MNANYGILPWSAKVQPHNEACHVECMTFAYSSGSIIRDHAIPSKICENNVTTYCDHIIHVILILNISGPRGTTFQVIEFSIL